MNNVAKRKCKFIDLQDITEDLAKMEINCLCYFHKLIICMTVVNTSCEYMSCESKECHLWQRFIITHLFQSPPLAVKPTDSDVFTIIFSLN